MAVAIRSETGVLWEASCARVRRQLWRWAVAARSLLWSARVFTLRHRGPRAAARAAMHCPPLLRVRILRALGASIGEGTRIDAPFVLMNAESDFSNLRIGSDCFLGPNLVLDLTEPIGFERADGRLMALIRPIYSPWMWETWSHDGGKTWGPCVRGPFPGYAPSVPVRTESGLVMFPVRFPGLTIHTTTDDGMTWDGGGGGTYIDTSIWAMGSMVEVEPNLVLFLYMDSFDGKTRAQYIRVQPDGTLHPATKTERQ